MVLKAEVTVTTKYRNEVQHMGVVEYQTHLVPVCTVGPESWKQRGGFQITECVFL